MTSHEIADRSEAAVAAIIPRPVRVRRDRKDGHSIWLRLNEMYIRVEWLGEGGLRQARELLARRRNFADVVVARRMSPGARKARSSTGVGWVRWER